MNLILLEGDELSGLGSTDPPGKAGTVELLDSRATHLIDVLHVEPGSQVRCGIVNGPIGVGVVLRVTDGRVMLECRFEDRPEHFPRQPGVDLLIALPRPKVMRRLWAQLAALGVGQIILTNAERVERDYFDSRSLSVDIYRPLLLEGLQQARDTRVPAVSIHRRFRVLIEDELDAISPSGVRLAADPAADLNIRGVLEGRSLAADASDHDRRVLLAVGPEGGWNAFEIDLLTSHGFTAVSMGGRTLRTDTACIALLALVHDAI